MHVLGTLDATHEAAFRTLVMGGGTVDELTELEAA